MYIANIVTNSNITVDKYFNISNSLDNIIQDLPTLIIGWDIVKTINPDVDFIDKKLSYNIFWTFKKSERRDIYQEDLYNFITYCYKNLIKDIDYSFIDLITLTDSEIKESFNNIKKCKKSATYQYNDMIYVYCDNTIYGIDLKLVKYLDYDVKKTIEKIKKNSFVFLSGDQILIEYKDIIESLDNEVKYVPYLYTIEHE
jgi:hypothetical protein